MASCHQLCEVDTLGVAWHQAFRGRHPWLTDLVGPRLSCSSASEPCEGISSHCSLTTHWGRRSLSKGQPGHCRECPGSRAAWLGDLYCSCEVRGEGGAVGRLRARGGSVCPPGRRRTKAKEAQTLSVGHGQGCGGQEGGQDRLTAPLISAGRKLVVRRDGGTFGRTFQGGDCGGREDDGGQGR